MRLRDEHLLIGRFCTFSFEKPRSSNNMWQ